MFGYIVPNQGSMTDAQQERYQSFYCGLCHALGEAYGKRGRLTLSYDMTFFAMLLTSQYEPEERSDVCRCLLQPKRRHGYLKSPVFQYCADMNVLLAYFQLQDDWNDEHKVAARTEAQLLRARVGKIAEKYPQKISVVRAAIARLSDYERFESREIDDVAACTGEILSQVVAYREDRWTSTLCRMADALGRFVYLMDAWDDYQEDEKKERYNPLRAIAAGKDFEARCLAILTMLISECTDAFETLPLVQDVEILRNILYSGVWTRYEAKKEKAAKGEHL